MAYFKPRRNEQGLTEKRRLPGKPEGASIGHVSLYDAFVEALWKRTMDEYHRKEIGFGDRQFGKEPMDYPDKEVWWDDPRSGLDLSREYHKYYSEEDLEKERLLDRELEIMEKEFEKIRLSNPERFNVKGKSKSKEGLEDWRWFDKV